MASADASISSGLAQLQTLLGQVENPDSAETSSRALFTRVIVLDLGRQRWEAPQPFMRETRLSDAVECFYIRTQHMLWDEIGRLVSSGSVTPGMSADCPPLPLIKSVLSTLTFAEAALIDMACCFHHSITPSRARSKQFVMDTVGCCIAAWILTRQVADLLSLDQHTNTLATEARSSGASSSRKQSEPSNKVEHYLVVRPLLREVSSRIAAMNVTAASLLFLGAVLTGSAGQLRAAVDKTSAADAESSSSPSPSVGTVDQTALNATMLAVLGIATGIEGARNSIPALKRCRQFREEESERETDEEHPISPLFGDGTAAGDSFPDMLARVYSSSSSAWPLGPAIGLWLSMLPTEQSRKAAVAKVLRGKRHESGKWDWPVLTAEELGGKAKLEELLLEWDVSAAAMSR